MNWRIGEHPQRTVREKPLTLLKGLSLLEHVVNERLRQRDQDAIFQLAVQKRILIKEGCTILGRNLPTAFFDRRVIVIMNPYHPVQHSSGCFCRDCASLIK